VYCDTQPEVDHFRGRLSEGGEPGRCGWITDRYGVARQIVPTALGMMMQDPDPRKPERVMTALLRMGKPDIDGRGRAYEER